jgi:hypothetical protein
MTTKRMKITKIDNNLGFFKTTTSQSFFAVVDNCDLCMNTWIKIEAVFTTAKPSINIDIAVK